MDMFNVERPFVHSKSETVETSEKTEHARSITRDLELVDKTLNPHELRYPHILKELKHEGLLEAEITRVKSIFHTELVDFGTELDDDIWEMLTVLELFDPETARHCVDTYHIAKNKVEHRLSTGVVLAEWFHEEGVDTQTFFISCLLHDIGKIEVPHLVIVNRVGDRECAHLLYERKDDILSASLRKYFNDDSYTLPEYVDSEEALLRYLHDTLHIRPQVIAPVRLLLGDMQNEQQEELVRQLSHCECTLEDSLLHITQTHDQYSKEILSSSGREIEGILAGSHHVSRNNTYTISIGTLRVTVDLAHIIHLADVENAIMSMRHYKSNNTPLEALKILAIHAQHGSVDAYISYLWIADELSKNSNTIDLSNEKEKSNYDSVVTFLDEQQRLHPTYPDWHT